MHQEKRGTWYKEGGLAMLSGMLYGGSSTLFGHPFDTVKTKMQAQAGHMSHGGKKSMTYMESVLKLASDEGLKGFYRGWHSPFVGGIVFRSVQFSTYEMAFTKFQDNDFLCSKIPGTSGLEYRVPLGGLISGTCRAILENPFEYVKVKRQTGQSWVVKDSFKGFTNLYPRAVGMMTVYFCSVDTIRRHTNWWNSKIGQFTVNGGCAMLGWWIMWPCEVLKNMAQAENHSAGSTTKERINYIWRTQGIKGFYRGSMPGLQSVFLRNGAAMIVMQEANKMITHLGLRD